MCLLGPQTKKPMDDHILISLEHVVPVESALWLLMTLRPFIGAYQEHPNVMFNCTPGAWSYYEQNFGGLFQSSVTPNFSMMTSSNGSIFRVTGHLCGNSPVPGEFPTQRPVTRSFDVFFDLRLNKRLSKQSSGWWFKTLSRPLWRHCNVNFLDILRHRQLTFFESSQYSPGSNRIVATLYIVLYWKALQRKLIVLCFCILDLLQTFSIRNIFLLAFFMQLRKGCIFLYLFCMHW